jgi:YD repeat-containing protein
MRVMSPLFHRECPEVMHRLIAAILVRALLLIGFAAFAPFAEEVKASGASLAATPTPPPAPAVQVNRTPPSVTPPASKFSPPNPATAEALENAHLFPEALAPVRGTPTAAENAALATALSSYASSRDITVLEGYASGNGTSPWLAGVLTNLGLIEYQEGYFSKALADWKKAWTLGKSDTTPAAHAIVNRAIAEEIRLNNRIGRVSESKALLAQIGDRPFSGLTALMISQARQAVDEMEIVPKDCFKCGPYAVGNILTFLNKQNPKATKMIRDYVTTAKGTSLAEVLAVSNQLGLKMQAAKRVSGTALRLPAVVNWKLAHYGALLRQSGNRCLLIDPTFGMPKWVLKEAVDQEASGYFLIPAGPLPAGWVPVSAREAGTVWGRGNGGPGHGGSPGANSPKSGGSGGGGGNKKGKPKPNPCGMAGWVFDTSYASLNITDTPLYYDPPIGPEISFDVNYDSMEENQPATIDFSNLGPLWNFSWLSTITFDSTDAYVNMGTGGFEDYIDFNSTTQSYDPDPESDCVLVEVSSTDYERRAPDGSKMVFALADPSGRLYLTQNVDPQGNAVTMSYDANFRLVSVTDAIGQVTTLTYGSNTSTDPTFYNIAKVTDPFGRSASFTYNSGGQLTQITDEIGMSSQFAYGANDFVQTLTTPYGATTFVLTGTTTTANGAVTSLAATEPNGAQQRIDAVQISTITPDSETVVPAGMPTTNEYLEYRNSYFWDRKAMHDAPGDYTKAELTHFLHDLSSFGPEGDIIESTKKPLESRVWYFYQNENPDLSFSSIPGMLANPVDIGRVLDDNSTQLYQNTYNAESQPTRTIDPLGRTTSQCQRNRPTRFAHVGQQTPPPDHHRSGWRNLDVHL